MNYKVSVIVPVYNAGKYLRECIESVVNQTLSDIEIIIIDDGSTDNSSDIIMEFAKKDSRIKYAYQENSGIAKARAEGFKLASGQYIGWVDNDDFIELNMFEKLFEIANREEADLVICDYKFFPKKVPGKEKWFKEYKGVKDWNFIERNTHPWNKLIRRDLCNKIMFYDTLLEFGDSAYVKALLYSSKPITIKDELYNYRVGQESTSYGYKNKCSYFEGITLTTKKQMSFLDGLSKDEYECNKEYFEYRYIYSLLQLIIVSAYNNNKLLFQKTKGKLKKEKYKHNKLLWKIMKNNHGIIKAFIACYILPLSYKCASIITRRVYS